MKLDKELKGLAKSFTFAFRGIRNCINSERNMRIHITITLFMLMFSVFYDFTEAQYAVLILSSGFVIGSEMMNTAIEAVVDMVSPTYSKMAQVAKDIAAGAVFISALSAFCIGVMFYFDIDIFKKIYLFFITEPVFIPILIFLIVTAVFFIFGGVRKKNKYNIRKKQ